MRLSRDRVIGALALMKLPFRKDMEMHDILDTAIEMLKEDAPVEPEEVHVRDDDTGRLTVIHFCGHCTRKLSNKPFCPHCGKKVARHGKD